MLADKACSRTPPPSFPVEPVISLVGGAQPKLALCRAENGAYVSPKRSPEEIWQRYEAADDLVVQLVGYLARKKTECPAWTDEVHLERIRRGIARKVDQGKWPFSEAEQRWIMARLRERCCEAQSSV